MRAARVGANKGSPEPATPEAAKPRKIAVGTNGEPVQPQVTEQKAA